MKERICIGGYAGCGNLGDDAILEGYLSERRDRADITVLTGHPSRDRRRFSVKCVGRMRPLAVLFTLWRSHVFLCGGGSLLQNLTGNRSLLYYLSLLRLAQLCGCRTELLAAGIGPIEGKRALRWTVSVLRRCDRIGLRDGVSYRFLQSLGIPEDLLFLQKDPALRAFSVSPQRLRHLKFENGLRDGEGYCCIVPQAAPETALAAVTAELASLVAHTAVTPVFLLFDRHDDKTARRMQQKLGGIVVRPRDSSEARAWIGGSRFTVSQRLHPLIFAEGSHTPALGLSLTKQEPKIRAFCLEHRIPHLFVCEL